MRPVTEPPMLKLLEFVEFDPVPESDPVPEAPAPTHEEQRSGAARDTNNSQDFSFTTLSGIGSGESHNGVARSTGPVFYETTCFLAGSWGSKSRGVLLQEKVLSQEKNGSAPATQLRVKVTGYWYTCRVRKSLPMPSETGFEEHPATLAAPAVRLLALPASPSAVHADGVALCEYPQRTTKKRKAQLRLPRSKP